MLHPNGGIQDSLEAMDLVKFGYCIFFELLGSGYADHHSERGSRLPPVVADAQSQEEHQEGSLLDHIQHHRREQGPDSGESSQSPQSMYAVHTHAAAETMSAARGCAGRD